MINKVILLGRLGGDPELKYTANGNAVATFSLATSEKYTDKSGNKQETTEWHKIVVWQKLAELCQANIRKGDQIYIEGKIQTRSWDDNDGNKRYITEITAKTIQWFHKNQESNQSQRQEPSSSKAYNDL